jgi:NAD-dependent deacetylase
VKFGEMLEPAVLARAEFDAKRCDLLLSVGTSAVVYPAAGLIEKVPMRRSNAGSRVSPFWPRFSAYARVYNAADGRSVTRRCSPLSRHSSR